MLLILSIGPFYLLPPISSTNYPWFLALLISLVSTAISLLVVQFTNSTRKHHTTKLVNEIFGKIQFTFFGFFFSLGMVDVWKQPVQKEIGLFALVFFLFFVFGVIVISRQDHQLKSLGHTCVRNCSDRLPFKLFFRICWINTGLLLISIYTSYCFLGNRFP